jgi:HSP20 family molecular chaperone IbpA
MSQITKELDALSRKMFMSYPRIFSEALGFYEKDELLALSEDDDNFYVSGTILGLTQEGVSIGIVNGLITITIDQETEVSSTPGQPKIKRSFYEKKSFYLYNVKSDLITASLIDGKFTVTLPKVDSIRTKRVKIETK